MAVSLRQRRWILGITLLLTVAAAASVETQVDEDNGVVQADTSRVRVQQQKVDPMASAEPSVSVSSAGDFAGDILVEKLKRPALPEKIKNMFPTKSWYVPPPVSKIVQRPSAPSLPFVYIGSMREDENKYSVFLERQGRTYIVSAGDTIDVNYRVEAITPPIMTLIYLPLDEKQTVQIGEVN